MTFHSVATLGFRHPVHNWEYANAAARTGASGFVAADIGKVAFQLDDKSFWGLQDTTPTWVDLSSTMGAAHALGGSQHTADTLANLNSKVSDATLDDSGDPRTPTAHAASHQHLGSDEVGAGTPAANAIPKANGTGKLADGWVSESSVTQHEAAIDHDALTNYDIAQHRQINDGGASTTELWSASKIDSELSAVVAGVDIKAGVDTASTGHGNITLSGEQTLNGLLTSNSRVLVDEQTAPADNGIYITAAGAWTRATDADEDAEVTNGNIVHVINSGSTKYKHKYLLVTADPITVGTTGQTWEEHKDIDFGTTSGTAAEGDDGRIPTQDENDALVGTSGTPSTSNKYVTNADPRNSDARTPTGAAGGDVGGTFPSSLTVTDLTIASEAHGDILIRGATGWKRLAAGTSGQHLRTNGAAADPSWETPVAGGGFTLGFDLNDASFLSSPAQGKSRNNHPIIAFDDTTDENVVLSDVLPGAYASGSNISVRIDWVAASATSGDVVWGLELERVAAGGHDIDSDSFDTQKTGTSTTNATSGIPTRTTITLDNSEADAIAAGDRFRLRVERVATSGSDTMSGDAEIVAVSLVQ
jgi:hypothetical protein